MQMIKREDTKRGDTIIEVMFAIAIFGLVAILSISSMNRGVVTAETTLEATTARDELNAQAEALRFMHNSLDYSDSGEIWKKVTVNAITAEEADKLGLLDLASNVVTPDSNGVVGCDKLYDNTNGKTLLEQANAFVVNTRKYKYVGINDGGELFRASPLGARMLWTTDTDGKDLTDVGISGNSLTEYSELAAVEGIWAFAVKSDQKDQNNLEKSAYYDIYVEACWYGSGANTPTVLDTVIRLNNPRTM